ncbi:MAG: protein kinase [Thermoguttaceae bacterium]|nr:protein kinase [Thermoguttaceae bacterium]
MGTVYRGIHVKTRVPVAIKMLAEPLADDENFRQRFNKEIEALRQLRHPNIVRLLGYGQEDDSYYYVMELVEGHSLEEELRSGRRFTWRETLSMAVQIASALNCAHNHGIIHRDLKPANLMLAENGIVKLSDFGIATLFGSSKITNAGNIVGTLSYMAPEQALGQPTNMRSDLFSFGAVLTALMTGKPPFKGSTLPEVLHQHATARARRPSQLGIDIPVEFDELIGRLLERDPEKRPKNAYFVMRLLEAIQEETSEQSKAGQGTGTGSSVLVPLSTDVLQKKLSENRGSSESDPEEKIPEESPELSLELEPETGKENAQDVSEAEEKPEENLDETPAETDLSVSASQTVTLDEPKGPKQEETPNTVRPKETSAGESRSFFREEKEEQKKTAGSGESPWAALLMVLVLSAVCILFIAHLIRAWATPPPADDLYAKIMAEAENEDSITKSSFIRNVNIFLSCYSQDPRAKKVQEFQTEIDLDRLERQLLRHSRGSYFRSVPAIERDYLNAVRTLQTQPEVAVQKLEDFICFYEASCDTLKKNPDFSREELLKNMRYLEVARRQVFRIRQVFAAEKEERRKILEQEVEHTLELLRSDLPEDVERGEKLREATLDLYQTREPDLVAPLLEQKVE